VVLLDQDVEPYVLTWPDGEELDGTLEVKVLAVLRRNDGLLLAVPNLGCSRLSWMEVG
jgi:hypothetical protein